MAKGPKSKGKLASALSGAQAAHAARQAQERAQQAERDRQQAVKVKMAAGGGKANKKRKLANAAAAAAGDDGEGKGKERAEAGSDDEDERPKKRGTQPFRRGERILLVGEGNFSFSHSLLLPLTSSTSIAPVQPLITPSLLLCTAFDSEKVASEKYPDLSVHVSALRAAGATVLFGVDATKLEECKEVREFAGLGKPKMSRNGKGKEMQGSEDGAGGFDRIVFNFPHVGQGITDQARNVRMNQTLLLDFYRSASLLLRRGTPRAPGSFSSASAAGPSRTRDSVTPPPADIDADEDLDLQLVPPPPSTRGSVLLTLRTTAPYSLWLPSQLATKGALLLPSILPAHELKLRLAAGEQPTYKTVRSWGFEPGEWEGYEHRRTLGWDEKISSGKNEDLLLTAKERAAKRFGADGAKGGKAAQEGKKEPPMRTWEFELVYAREKRIAAERGGGGGGGGKNGARAGKRKRGGPGGADDPDLSDS
ncbi:hypothetical protein JCM10213_009097 [Rhodosporidiobolus nylandii]